MEIQTYPDNSGTDIYGSNTRIAIGVVYSDRTLCINFHRAYSNSYVLSFALTYSLGRVAGDYSMIRDVMCYD